jgi:hypothetical protein
MIAYTKVAFPRFPHCNKFRVATTNKPDRRSQAFTQYGAFTNANTNIVVAIIRYVTVIVAEEYCSEVRVTRTFRIPEISRPVRRKSPLHFKKSLEINPDPDEASGRGIVC